MVSDERLLQLPLFLGLSKNELFHIKGLLHFNFIKRVEGSLIIKQNVPCKSLYFILDGTIMARYKNKAHTFVLKEWVNGKNIILQPECLFGLYSYFTREYSAATSCNILEISKSDIRDIMLNFSVVRMNFLNLLSSLSQHNFDVLNYKPHQLLEERLYYFIYDRCQWRYGRKELKIKMTELADFLLTSRLNVSKLLHQLEEREIVVMRRGVIEFVDFALWDVSRK